MAVISLLLVIVMHLLKLLLAKIILKKRIICSRRVRGKKNQGKLRIWWQWSPVDHQHLTRALLEQK